MPDIQEGDGIGTLDPESPLTPGEQAVLDVPPEVEETDSEPPEFDHRYVEPFEGLMYLGALTKEFEWLGHKFVIRTLTTNEMLIVPLVIKQWENTIGHARAYAACMVALATVTVDGQHLPTPVESSDIGHAWAIQRFNHVTGRWFPYTIDKVYSEYLELEAEASKTVEAMGNAFG
jgi:hypothetical protein